MLRIRLQRMGKKKQPTYRLIVSERARDTQGDNLEILGLYNPVMKEKLIDLKVDRIKHWLSVGAQPSATVHNLLVTEGVIEGDKQRVVTLTNKRRGKLEKEQSEKETKKKEEEEKKKADAEAAKQAEKEAATKAAEEVKTEEVVEENNAEDVVKSEEEKAA